LGAGNQIIRELGRRGLRGFYFSYGQYRQLAGIKNFEDAKKKISEFGYPKVIEASTVENLVDLLKASGALSKKEKGCLVAMFFEPIFWILLALVSCS